jgi:hypothetical protein
MDFVVQMPALTTRPNLIGARQDFLATLYRFRPSFSPKSLRKPLCGRRIISAAKSSSAVQRCKRSRATNLLPAFSICISPALATTASKLISRRARVAPTIYLNLYLTTTEPTEFLTTRRKTIALRCGRPRIAVGCSPGWAQLS